MAEMISPLLWLSPAARDVLRSTSKLLKGNVPCAVPAFAQKLKDGDAANQCEGVLGDVRIRAALSKRLEDPPKQAASSPKSSPKKSPRGKASPKQAQAAAPVTISVPKDISDASAASLVDNLGAVLGEQIEEVKVKAAAIAKDLPDLTKIFSVKDMAAGLPKGVELGEAAKRDWIIWHGVGRGIDSKTLPALAAGVLKERLSLLVACGAAGAVTDCALAIHVLQNVESYIAWELTLPGSMPGKKAGVVNAFDKKMAREVAVRRVLSGILPMDVAASAAQDMSGGDSIRSVLDKLTASARNDVVIPMYIAPPAPAEPKAPKEKKDKGKDTADKKEDKAKPANSPKANSPKAAAAAAPVADSALASFYQATATRELQWHLLRYRLNPQTTLSKEVVATKASKESAPASPKQKRSAAATSAPPVARISGFAGTWADPAVLPPGHSPYSWLDAKAAGMSEGFPTTWSGDDGGMPPGHTLYSWEMCLKGGLTAANSSTAEAPKKGSPKKAAEKAPAASPKAAAAKATPAKAAAAAPSGDAPADGTPEAAMLKLDFRAGLIKSVEKVPNSDQLYLLKVDIGDEERQVITGLQKHYKEKDLQDRLVFVYCNIKPGKLAGYESQAMVMAGTIGEKGTDSEKCELLEPPKGTKVGTRPSCGSLEVGANSAGVSVKNISKQFGAAKPLLLTNTKKEACFNGVPLTMDGKPITIKNLPGAQIS